MSDIPCFHLIEPLKSTSPQLRFRARDALMRRGERPATIWYIEEGWAARFKLFRDGRRHISRFYAPGDFCDLSWLVAGAADQSVMALTPLRAAQIERTRLDARLRSDTTLALAVARDALAEMRWQSEWLVTIGCKSAAERIAQFLCELYFRLERRGKAREKICDFPLSQQDVADFTGMTAVHACRTLRELRNCGVIELRRRRLRIIDFPRLVRMAAFDANYLEDPMAETASGQPTPAARPAILHANAAAC
jgi:CRP-like cAMP-binding protein